LDGVPALVGRQAFLVDSGIDCTGMDLTDLDGFSLLWVAHGGVLLGVVALADTVRPTSPATMEELEELGVRHRVMITGDRRGPAERTAREVKVTHFEAEALPGDKLRLVEELQAQGHCVAVVGDGVNDGPALAKGDVSIAMGAAGSDVAIHSATIALMNSNLNRIPFLLRLSRRTVTVVRQNLVLVALSILVLLGLLTAGVDNLPVITALAHGLVSLLVIFNSARLVREGEGISDEHDEKPVASRAATSRLERVA
jgi:Cd2+/Zn2+-exporting ATPase